MLTILRTSLILILFSPLAQTAAQEATEQAPVLRLWEQLDADALVLHSKAALITDQFGNRLYAKQADTARPIASLSKLMTAMVVLDAGQPLDETIEITEADQDTLKLTGSRLHFGAKLSRGEALSLALLASENRAASALARHYPGGTQAFVAAMNAKAKALRMYDARFVEPTGLDPRNVASPADIARMLVAAERYPLISEITNRPEETVRPYADKGPMRFGNTNRLLSNDSWNIHLGKTGYIAEAGRCLAMVVTENQTRMVMVFLDSFGKLTPYGDANRSRKWLRAGIEEQRAVLAQRGER